MADVRAHRVARLRSDEAKYVEREASGHMGTRSCCPHLSVFHTYSRGDFGDRYICNVDGCGCIDEYPPSALALRMREEDKLVEQQERSETFVRGWLFGALLGALVSSLIWWLA